MAVVINGTTGISGVDGTASTPALQGTDNNTGVFFGADTVTISTGGTSAVTVDSGQRTKFPTTIGVGGATPSTSGSGISFPATQSASTDANTLDDYEEGTFTPTIIGSSSAGTGTYSIQTGRYVKIGNRILFNIYLVWSAHTGTGNMSVAGLPFSTTNEVASYCSISVYVDTAITLTAGNILQVRTDQNATTLFFAQTATGGSNAAAVSIDTNAGVMLAGHYYTT